MSGKTKIEWTTDTWNPVTGCTKVSTGCKNCYAERMAKRLQSMGNPRYVNGFNIKLHYDLIDAPMKWKKPRKIFVNSMSDMFHEQIPDEFIIDVFKTMNTTPRHTYQILTKRPARIDKLNDKLTWTDNIWIGTSIENELQKQRINHIRDIPAKIKFISAEPLLECLGDINLQGIDWVIVGGESGPKSRPIEEAWVLNILRQCEDNGVAFFFKQWGGINKKKNGRQLNGIEYNNFPLQI